MVTATVQLGPLTLKNPVIAASGTFGYGLEYSPHMDLSRLGGFVVKGLSLEPHPGNPPPRIIETTGGMLNAIGLQNIGVDAFVKEKLPLLHQYDAALIVNVWGNTVEDYVEVARRLSDAEGIDALEINISCPNIKAGGMAFGKDAAQAGMLTQRVRETTSLPLMVKLTPNAANIVEVAQSVERAGAEIISLVNTFLGMAIDVETATPVLATITGGLSGPAIKPIALRMVWEVAQAVSIPVVGMGGITTGRDALEFIIAGARAVQVGTANFINPAICIEIIQDIEQYLKTNSIASIGHLVGSLKIPSHEKACH